MRKISARLPDHLVEALDYLKKEWGIAKTDVVRQSLNQTIGDDPEHLDIPDWMVNDAIHDRVKQENRAELRKAHFKQNVYEYLLHDCLRGRDGGMARFPPDPDALRDSYIASMREEIQETVDDGELLQEYENHLEEMIEWYEIMHPDADGSRTEQYYNVCRFMIRWEDEEEARRFLDEQDRRGKIPDTITPHEILDDARDDVRQANWKNDWDDAIRP